MATTKKKAGLITSGITTIGSVVTAITVPIIQKIDKEEDAVYALLNKIHKFEIEQKDNITRVINSLDQKNHEQDLKIQENKLRLELQSVEDSKKGDEDEDK